MSRVRLTLCGCKSVFGFCDKKDHMKSAFPKPIYLGASTRSPIGKFGGSLKRFSAPAIASLTLKEALGRVKKLSGDVIAQKTDFVFMGHARQAGCGPNPARQATVFSGLSENIPALTLNQACASGMAAIFYAAEKIALGRAENICAGGVESMSNTPYFLMDARWGTKLGHGTVVDGMYKDGFHCPMADMVMGETVENFVAKKRGISRKDQDAWALLSQQRAAAAWASSAFKAETFEIPAEGKKPGLNTDEHARADTSVDSLAKLPPVFDVKNGTITAGNASGIADGAAFLHVSSSRHPHAEVELVDFECVALDPSSMGLGPIPAIQNLLKRQGLGVKDVDFFEINEAFAAMILAAESDLKLERERLNVRGGAIALGHPIGASAARIVVSLTHILKTKPGSIGVAAACVSGGMGVAALLRSL